MQNDGQGGDVGGDDDGNDNDNRYRLADELEKLRNNEICEFIFGEAQIDIFGACQRWNSLDVRDLSDSLTVNTSIVHMNIDLHICTVPAISVFLPFIRSTRRLKELKVTYSRYDFRDRKEIQYEYQTQMSHIVRSVIQNPSIETSTLGGSLGKSSEAMYDLLSTTKTLKSFTCYRADITEEMALAIAGGLTRNSSLQKFTLWNTNGHFDIALAGISGCASTIETLRLQNVGEDSKRRIAGNFQSFMCFPFHEDAGNL